MPATKKCPTCGTENAGEAKFCFGCGEKMEIAEPAAVAPAPGNGPVVCPQCKTSNAPNATFCARCGANLADAVKKEAEAPNEQSAASDATPVVAAPAPKAGVCRKCNFENNPEFKFCARCGSKLLPPAPPKPQVVVVPGKCNKCGTQNDPAFAFCARCGSKLGGKAKAPKAINQSTGFSGAAILGNMSLRDIIRNGVLLLLAILMTVFAFLPVFKYEYTQEFYGEDISVEYSFSAVSAVTLLLDSFKEDNEDILEDYDALWDELMEEIEEAAEDLDEDDKDYEDELAKITEDLTDKYANEIALLTLRAEYATEEYTTKLRDIIGALSAVLYIVVALAFLAFAALNFAFEALGKKSFFKTAVTLMCLLASLVPAVSFAVGAMVCQSGAIGAGGTLIMVFTFIAVAAALAERFIFDKCGVNVKAIVTRTLSAVLVGIMLILSTSAVATVTVEKAKYTKGDATKETTVSVKLDTAEFNRIFDLSEEEIEAFPKKISKSEAKEMLSGVESVAQNVFISYTKAQIEDGEADSAIYSTVKAIVLVSGGTGIASILSLANVVTLLMILAAGIILWQTLLAIANGSANKKAINLARIFNVILAAASIAFAIIFILYAKTSIDLVKMKKISTGIGTGIIFYAIMAIGHFFVPFGKKEAEESFDYDEDDFAA